MPTFFSKVFKSKDSAGTSSKNKKGQLNNEGPVVPQKPKYEDAWLRTEVTPEEVQELLRGCTAEIKSRGM
jgi:hypothetical protein